MARIQSSSLPGVDRDGAGSGQSQIVQRVAQRMAPAIAAVARSAEEVTTIRQQRLALARMSSSERE